MTHFMHRLVEWHDVLTDSSICVDAIAGWLCSLTGAFFDGKKKKLEEIMRHKPYVSHAYDYADRDWGRKKNLRK